MFLFKTLSLDTLNPATNSDPKLHIGLNSSPLKGERSLKFCVIGTHVEKVSVL